MVVDGVVLVLEAVDELVEVNEVVVVVAADELLLGVDLLVLDGVLMVVVLVADVDKLVGIVRRVCEVDE